MSSRINSFGGGSFENWAGLRVRLLRMIPARVRVSSLSISNEYGNYAFSKITLTFAPPKPLLLLMIRSTD